MCERSKFAVRSCVRSFVLRFLHNKYVQAQTLDIRRWTLLRAATQEITVNRTFLSFIDVRDRQSDNDETVRVYKLARLLAMAR